MTDIAVIDYGMGNLRSVAKAIEHVAPHARVIVTSDPQVVAHAGRVVFPGQGAMPDCMRELDARGLRAAVIDAARNKPFLGICIGLQMLFEHSEEGDTPGLGILAGKVVRFAHAAKDDNGVRLKVPHMGWNEVRQIKQARQAGIAPAPHALWQGIDDGARFYFVHSYYVQPHNAGIGGDGDISAGISAYPHDFTCAVARENLFAVQFHPEKSAAAGLKLLENFTRWQPA